MIKKFASILKTNLLLAILILIVGYLILLPTIFLLISSFKPTGLPFDEGITIANFIKAYSDWHTYSVLKTTILFAVGSSSIAMLIGGLLAWMIERTDVPLKRLLRVAIIIPMAIPPLVLAIGWILILSPKIGVINNLLVQLLSLKQAPFDIYSLGGMIFVQSIAAVPTTFLIFSPNLRNMDPALEEAALMAGGGWKTVLTKITVPLLIPAIVATSMLLLIVGLVSFDVAGILGMPKNIFVFSTEVYNLANPVVGLPKYGLVSAYSVFFLFIVGIASFLYFKATKQSSKFVTVSGRGYRSKILNTGKWKYILFSIIVLYIIAGVGFPVTALIITSLQPYYKNLLSTNLSQLGFANYIKIFNFSGFWQATKNSAIVVLTSTILVVFLSAVISWVVIRTKNLGARILDVLAFLPIGLPYTLLALALLYLYTTFKFIPIYGTVWILVVAYVTHYLSFGTRNINSAIYQISNELEEAAYVNGASKIQVFTKIVIPLISTSLVAVGIWVAAHALREVSVAIFLYSYKNQVVPTLLWDYWSMGEIGKASTVGVLLIIPLIILTFCFQMFERKSGDDLENK